MVRRKEIMMSESSSTPNIWAPDITTAALSQLFTELELCRPEGDRWVVLCEMYDESIGLNYKVFSDYYFFNVDQVSQELREIRELLDQMISRMDQLPLPAKHITGWISRADEKHLNRLVEKSLQRYRNGGGPLPRGALMRPLLMRENRCLKRIIDSQIQKLELYSPPWANNDLASLLKAVKKTDRSFLPDIDINKTAWRNFISNLASARDIKTDYLQENWDYIEEYSKLILYESMIFT